MFITILSDTHYPSKRVSQIPNWFEPYLCRSDLIIHLGDWNTLEMADYLMQFAPVYGVYGNNDTEGIVEKFPDRQVLELEGIRIGMIHGHGRGGTTEQRAIQAFEDDLPDVILFGHSHIPLLSQEASLTLFNPGSASDRRRQPLFSIGTMKLERGVYELKHCYAEEKYI